MDAKSTLKAISEILKDCVKDDTNACAVVVGYDYDSKVVKIYGLNVQEWEVADLLFDAAETTEQFVQQHMDTRTLN